MVGIIPAEAGIVWNQDAMCVCWPRVTVLTTMAKKKRIEEVLRRGMASVGYVVEKAIGKAQEARKTVVPSTGAVRKHAATGDVLEVRLAMPKVKDLLQTSVERLVPTVFPALSGRRALEIGEGAGRYAPSLKDHGAQLVVATEIGAGGIENTHATESVNRLYLVRAAIHRLPFADSVFDFVVANLVTPYQGNFLQALKELSRVMAPGGTLLVTDFHPFGAYARRGTARIRPTESSFRGMADYYKAARLAGLRVADLREGFIDETVRAVFQTQEEKETYRDFRDTPLILCLIARKGVSEGGGV
ncbi:MAG: class I SAM-dependent methyltransferase [Deltaproteobacteria bacterium]|nr:class I SAM-dependent methyltransferase [Deltaproteobacteria bacterium]